MMPRLISGWPNRADCAAIRTSQPIAISQPPPNAIALTAAIVAIPERSISRSSPCAPPMNSFPLLASSCVNALMSAPAQNTCGLADARTSARTVPPSRTWFHTRRRSSTTFGDSAFIGGLSSHAIAMSPRVSSVTVPPWSKPSSSGRL